MEKLTIRQMEIINGGDFIDGFCAAIGGGSIIYAIGVETNFWNPIGWVSAGFLAADAACLIYGASQLE